jgi:hypothetical protein
MTPSSINRIVTEATFILAIEDHAQQDLALTALARRIARQVAPDKVHAVVDGCRGRHLHGLGDRRPRTIGTA